MPSLCRRNRRGWSLPGKLWSLGRDTDDDKGTQSHGSKGRNGASQEQSTHHTMHWAGALVGSSFLMGFLVGLDPLEQEVLLG